MGHIYRYFPIVGNLQKDFGLAFSANQPSAASS
jgi:hypothetical protein